ncbi:serine hydrolase [Streptomyces sp. UNOC14_S4]|uniref:serine hydrolase domain-containing protein n=1 Tax=Streptomyces sp. UNOC14_S4 TaxID=2872340 RepID=UPI001E38EB26|nr:serine hydrolase domain-containing protein [Streptomyces sp. UNOC14_S4]MCC3767635.1 beta-lactamase family protein [Streptomyces sp. UNOC14_S4]
MTVRTVCTVRTVRRALVGALVAATATATVLTSSASATSASSISSASAQDRASALRAAMEAQVKGGVPGVLGRTEDGGDVWQGSAGVADRDTQRPRQAQDRFRVGSISKAFTSVVLLQQEAEGRISLDDTVDHWLPGVVRGGHDGRAITVRQLLNHTSGIFNYTQDPAVVAALTTDFQRHRFDTKTPRQLVDIAMKHAPDFRPGEGWNYSNTNYVLAGMIVEKVSGHSYATEIERRVLKPLGMRATTLPGASPWMPNPHGRAYSKLEIQPAPDAKIYDVTDFNPSWAGAAGEIISTTGDLNTFYRALLGGKLLPQPQQRELLTTVSTRGRLPGASYGLGVYAQKLSCGVDIWAHGGGIPGSASMVAATPDGKHTAAFNFNGDWSGDSNALLEAGYCGKVPEDNGKPGPAAAITALR